MQRSNARWASSIVPVASIVANAGNRSPGAAVHSGSALSAVLSFTTGLRIFHSSRRVRKSAGTSESICSARLGSALQTTVRARISVPSSSRTPSSGTISLTLTPAASVAPASWAASAIANETIPIPPRT